VDALDLDGYRYVHATRGELLRRVARDEEAREAYERAIGLTPAGPERRFLERRVALLARPPS
jgi:RNA polymerase sigma-70 factor (ECF subfamily)